MFRVCADTSAGKALTLSIWIMPLAMAVFLSGGLARALADNSSESSAEHPAPTTNSPDDTTAGGKPEDLSKPVTDDVSEGESEGTTLIFMVRSGDHIKRATIDFNLREVMRVTGCKFSDFSVREVPQAAFEQIQAAVELIEVPESPEFGDEIKLRRSPSVKTVWQISIPGEDGEVLKEFVITYRAGGEGGRSETRTYEPKRIAEAGGPGSLAVISAPQGRYEFRPDEAIDLPPVEYSAVLLGPGKERTVEGQFPIGDKFFVVSIANFRGSRKTLFEKLQDGNVVANPFSAIPDASIALVFGSLEATTGLTGEGIVGVNLRVSVTGVADRPVARVWMLFPLTKEECDQWCAQLDATASPIEDIPKLVRQNAVSAGEEDVTVLSLDKPKWFELSDRAGAGSGFGRDIRLVENTADFQALHERYPSAHRILVWEFGRQEEGQTLQAIEVHGRFYRRDEIGGWSDQISRVVTAGQTAETPE